MPSFFTSSTPKKPTPVFAGIDDPFNFPASRMKYKTPSPSRTSSPDSTSATDSGYGSIDSSDNDTPLSPKSAAPRHKRRLQRDSKGHWRTHSYEYQSEDNDAQAERTPILHTHNTSPATTTTTTVQDGPGKAPDNDHAWKPNLKHTFTLIVDDSKPKKETWFAKRVYGRALRQKERAEGLTQLQREMAPVLRRAPLSPEGAMALHQHGKKAGSSTGGSSSGGVVRPVYGGRKQSTLLHPSAPASFPLPPPKSTIRIVPSTASTSTSTVTDSDGDAAHPRGRPRKPSTLLHPSPPPKDAKYTTATAAAAAAVSPDAKHEALRSPRHRSPTPLAIPEHSGGQPAPTPLRIHINRRSVLHSCFSDTEDEGEDERSEERGERCGERGERCGEQREKSAESGLDGGDEEGSGSESESDRYSVASIESAAGVRNGMILARTAVVAQAQRVRVVGASSSNGSINSGNVNGGSGGEEGRWRKRSSDLIPRCPEPIPR